MDNVRRSSRFPPSRRPHSRDSDPPRMKQPSRFGAVELCGREGFIGGELVDGVDEGGGFAAEAGGFGGCVNGAE